MTDTPSLVPASESSDVYLVLDELPTFGRVWRELSEEAPNKQAVLNLIVRLTRLKDGLAMLQGRLQKHCLSVKRVRVISATLPEYLSGGC